MTNCAVCGWFDERGYDPNCSCLPCSALSESHIDHHKAFKRKPMVLAGKAKEIDIAPAVEVAS